MTYTIKLRRGLSTEWATVNPVLAEGETGWELDTRNFKQGDGTTAWNDLPYVIDSNDRLPDASELPDNKILLTLDGAWIIADVPETGAEVATIQTAFTSTAGQDEFELPSVPVTGTVRVYRNGLLQGPLHWSLVGTTVTLTDPCGAGEQIMLVQDGPTGTLVVEAHTHSEYAPIVHEHEEYAPVEHSHLIVGGQYPGRSWPIDVVPSSPNSMDDEFTGSSLDPKWTLTYATATAPTVAFADGVMTAQWVVEAGWKLQGITQPLPASGDWEFILGIAGVDVSAFDYCMPAILALSAGTSGLSSAVKGVGLARFGNGGKQWAIGHFDLSTWGTYSGQADWLDNHVGDGYIKAKKVGTTYSFSFSMTGKRFYPYFSGTLGFTPQRIVIGGKSEHTDATLVPVGVFKWFRRTA